MAGITPHWTDACDQQWTWRTRAWSLSQVVPGKRAARTRQPCRPATHEPQRELLCRCGWKCDVLRDV